MNVSVILTGSLEAKKVPQGCASARGVGHGGEIMPHGSPTTQEKPK